MTQRTPFTSTAPLATIDGWIAPGGNVTVELRTEEGRRQVVADADGRFVFTDVPHGLDDAAELVGRRVA